MLQKRPDAFEKIGRNLSLTALVFMLAVLPLESKLESFYLAAQVLVLVGFGIRLAGQARWSLWATALGLFVLSMGLFSGLAFLYARGRGGPDFALEIIREMFSEVAILYFCALVVLLSQFLFRPEIWTTHDRWMKGMIAVAWGFGLVVLLSAIVSTDPEESFRYLRKYFMPYLLIYMVAIETLYSWRHYKIIITTIFLVGIVFTAASVSARYLYTYGPYDLRSEIDKRKIILAEPFWAEVDGETRQVTVLRNQWPFDHHNRLCSYALIVVLFVWLQFFVTRNWELKTLVAISAFFPFWTMILTLTRGGWVGLAAGAVVLVLALNWRSLWILLAIAFAAYLVSPDVIRSRMVSIVSPRTYLKSEGTFYLRTQIWKRSLESLMERPVLGLGPGWDVYQHYMSEKYPALNDEEVSHAHNNLLEIAFESGLLGAAFFLAFTALLIAQLWRAWRTTNPQTARRFVVAGFFGLLAAIVVFGTSNFSLRYNVGMLIWICFALITLLPAIARAIPEKVQENPTISAAEAASASA